MGVKNVAGIMNVRRKWNWCPSEPFQLAIVNCIRPDSGESSQLPQTIRPTNRCSCHAKWVGREFCPQLTR